MINFSYNPSSMSPDTALIRIGIFTAFGQALVLIGLACGICGWLEPKQK